MRVFQSKKGEKVLSILITSSIILLLLFLSPATAVRVEVKTDKSVFRQDSPVITFQTAVDVQKREIVPIKVLRLVINDGFRVCEFAPDGTNDCPYFTIIPKRVLESDTGIMEAKGFGFGNPERPRHDKTFFGFGYGFNEVEDPYLNGLNGELQYEIQWDVANDNVPNGRYQVTLQAEASNGDVSYTYTRNAKSFFIKR